MSSNDTFRLDAGTLPKSTKGLPPHPRIIDLVKLLARISANREFNKHTKRKKE